MKALSRALSILLLVAVVFSFMVTGIGEAAPPDSPELITVTVTSGSQVDLLWQDNSNNEAGFFIERKTGSGVYSVIGSVVPDVTTYLGAAAIPETTHVYRVRASNGDGDSYSNEISVTTMATPTALTAVGVSSNQVDLSWNDQTIYEDTYKIERKSPGGSYSVIDTVGAGVTNYSDLTVSGGTTYYYRVRAVNTDGYSSYSNEATDTTPVGNPPAAPTNLTHTAVTKDSITLSWTDNANNEEGFKIERKETSSGVFSVVGTVGPNETTYTNTGLTANTSYYYRISSHNSAGSAYSNVIVVSTSLGEPTAPSNLVVTAVTKNSVAISWTNNANNQAGFKIERKSGTTDFAEIGQVGPNTTTYINTPLAEDTTYHYRVRAFNDIGNSIYSNVVITATLLGVPVAPSNLKAVTVLKDSVALTWTDNANNESGYIVERKTGTGSYAEVKSLGANVTSYTDGNLTLNTTYSYRVKAYNAAGDSLGSNEITVKTLAGDLPAATSGLKVSATTKTTVTLVWTDNSSNETGFKIERKTGTGSFAQVGTVSANLTTYINTGLKDETEYTYRIRAYNTYGDSAYSGEVNVTTGDPPVAPSGLKVVEMTKNSVKISWTDNSDNETGFKIERKTGSGSFTQVGTTSANTVTYSNTGLSTSTTYTYRVRAYNGSGDSAFSSEISVVPTEAPLAPTNLIVTSTSGGAVTLAWTDNAGNETGFKIERKTGTGDYTEVGTVGANVKTYTNSGLASNTIYLYRVRAYNAAGNSAYSNETSTILAPVLVNLTIGKRTYTVNQVTKAMDVSPQILDGRTLLPFRYVAEAIGAQVSWDATTQKVTVSLDNTVIELWIGNPMAKVNGVEKRIDPGNLGVKPIVIPPGRTMLPIRFISENLGCSVDWNAQTQEVKITY